MYIKILKCTHIVQNNLLSYSNDDLKKYNYIHIEKINSKRFNVCFRDIVLVSDICILEFYVILFSFIKSKYIIVENLLMIKKGFNIEYRNLNFLMNFSYIDFKIWLIKDSYTRDVHNGSSLMDFDDEVELIFEFNLVDGCLEHMEKNLGKVEGIRPVYPILRQELMKEVLGEYDEVINFNDSKK